MLILHVTSLPPSFITFRLGDSVTSLAPLVAPASILPGMVPPRVVSGSSWREGGREPSWGTLTLLGHPDHPRTPQPTQGSASTGSGCPRAALLWCCTSARCLSRPRCWEAAARPDHPADSLGMTPRPGLGGSGWLGEDGDVHLGELFPAVTDHTQVLGGCCSPSPSVSARHS